MAASFEEFVRERAVGGFEEVSELWMRFAGPVPMPFAYRRGVYAPGKTLFENFLRIATLRESGGTSPLAADRRAELRQEWRRLPAIQREEYNPCFRRWAALEQGAGRDPSLLRWSAERPAFLAAHASDPLCLDLTPRKRRPQGGAERKVVVRGRSDFLRAAAGPISRIVSLSQDGGRGRFALQNRVWRRALALLEEPSGDCSPPIEFAAELDAAPGLEPHHRQALTEALLEATTGTTG